MTTLMKASNQWMNRPADERFVSLLDMRDHFAFQRQHSRQTVVSTRAIEARPCGDDHTGLAVVGPQGNEFEPTHWSFGQLAALSEAPAGYLRTLPSAIAADCVNYGLKFKRNIEDVGLLLYKNGTSELRAATGPRYGRIWNDDIVHTLVSNFGDGVSGDWKVPGEFGKDITVTKDNTTLYASDRDMFVFLADEHNRIEIPNRRNGKPGTLARGFFVWNSEVGSATFGLGTFLFDYVCCNRIVWGAEEYREIKIRHTASAPDKWLEELRPALTSYANASASNIVEGVAKAQASKIDQLDEFLAKRFGNKLVEPMKMVHTLEEGKPIENLWDAVTAVTAYAKSVPNQSERIKLERQAGELLDLVATK